MKIKEKFLAFWNDNKISEREWQDYYAYCNKLRKQGKSTSDVMMPIGKRDMILAFLSVLLIAGILLAFLV